MDRRNEPPAVLRIERGALGAITKSAGQVAVRPTFPVDLQDPQPSEAVAAVDTDLARFTAAAKAGLRRSARLLIASHEPVALVTGSLD